MKKQTVNFTFYASDDNEYAVRAVITPGSPAPAQNFDRFQEPDDPGEVEITSITDEDGNEIDTDNFSDKDWQRMEEKAFEEAGEWDETWDLF
jgi:hypothetical protein